jgi:hypothetical protein
METEKLWLLSSTILSRAGDFLIDRPTVTIDGKLVLKNGKFTV